MPQCRVSRSRVARQALACQKKSLLDGHVACIQASALGQGSLQGEPLRDSVVSMAGNPGSFHFRSLLAEPEVEDPGHRTGRGLASRTSMLAHAARTLRAPRMVKFSLARWLTRQGAESLFWTCFT